MKLERINDNQIRITLDPHDFDDFDVSVVDLLTDREGKAKEFIETLMGMAKDDLNFEADGSPIMVEVTQTGKDAIVLMVTKVDKDTKLRPGISNAPEAAVEEQAEAEDSKDDIPLPNIPIPVAENEKTITPSFGV